MGLWWPRQLPGQVRQKPKPKPKPKAVDAVVYAVHPPLAWIVDVVIIGVVSAAVTFVTLYSALLLVP